MERKEIEKVVKEVIFEKMGEFTGFNHAAEIDNEDGLATDMAMDSFDYAEVVMEIEKRMGISIPDETLNIKPYTKLTVGEFIDILYNYLNNHGERDKILKLARKEIFEKMHKFNYINNIEVIDDVKEDSNLSSDLAMNPFDLLEVLMEIEEKIGIRISDDVFGDKPVDELTVGIFADMLYVYFKDKQWISDMTIGKRG